MFHRGINMKKLLLSVLSIGITTSVYANCNYDQINSPEYKVDEITSKYMSNSFVLSEKTGLFSRSLNNRQYADFANSNLKVSRTNVPTKYTQELYRSKTDNVVIGGKSYTRDRYVTTEFITPSCKTIYYMGGMPKNDILKANGEKLDDQDQLHIFGGSITPVSIKAKSRYDEFDGMYSLSTDMFDDNYLIRGNYNKKTGQLVVLQIYLKNLSFTGWSHFKSARDTNGGSYSVTQIDNDVDCSSKSVGLPCKITEVVGINITENLLRENPNGFKLKLYGKQEIIIEISPEVIKPFLEELDKIKSI